MYKNRGGKEDKGGGAGGGGCRGFSATAAIIEGVYIIKRYRGEKSARGANGKTRLKFDDTRGPDGNKRGENYFDFIAGNLFPEGVSAKFLCDCFPPFRARGRCYG